MNEQTLSSPQQSSQLPKRISRRDFISMLWKGLLGLGGALGLAGLWRFFSYQPYPPTPTIFDLGPVDELPQGALIRIAEAEAVLLTTQSSYKALSLICPHLGCIVEPFEEGFTCPCHNSRFSLEGDVLKGPADQPLRTLKLEIDEAGHLLLDISENG